MLTEHQHKLRILQQIRVEDRKRERRWHTNTQTVPRAEKRMTTVPAPTRLTHGRVSTGTGRQ